MRRIPDTRLLPDERRICGPIGMAPYALPGSEALGRNIAAVFEAGNDVVMLENHGVVGSTNLSEAFRMFESLDFCARLEIEARRIGSPVFLKDEDYETVQRNGQVRLPSFMPDTVTAEEKDSRRSMREFIRRAYDQGLFTSTQGTFSQRLSCVGFLITPHGQDRMELEPGDFVRVEDGKVEAGKTPSHSVLLHEAIYRLQPHVSSVIIAHPPNIMAFAVTETEFDSRTIPESYILLRGMPKVDFGAVYEDPEATAALMKPDTPIAIVRNNCVIVTGQGLLNTFDRLEVAEYSAKSILAAKALGEIVHIDEAWIRELEIAFHLD